MIERVRSQSKVVGIRRSGWLDIFFRLLSETNQW